MNNTNLKENMSVMDLMECVYDEVNGFEQWALDTLNLASCLDMMTKDQMIDGAVWELIMDTLGEIDEKPGGLTLLISMAWNELEGFKKWILKHLEIDEYVEDMGPEFVQDGRDLELVLKILE